ncbi:uncharacterized protein [Rutidosis leptorrhynchoides]|uniref:uncharacterized protein n=1 Tax=Rutidosis leptorrhynchoides TaxID=125765 RepID=UPI003A992B07
MEIEHIGCLLCDYTVESLDHLLFSCDFSKEIWRKMRIWVDVNELREFSSWSDWIGWFDSWSSSIDSKNRLYVIVASLLWHVWRFCNDTLFGSRSMKKNTLFDSIRYFSFSWLCNRGKCNIRWIDWLVKPLYTTSTFSPIGHFIAIKLEQLTNVKCFAEAGGQHVSGMGR